MFLKMPRCINDETGRCSTDKTPVSFIGLKRGTVRSLHPTLMAFATSKLGIAQLHFTMQGTNVHKQDGCRLSFPHFHSALRSLNSCSSHTQWQSQIYLPSPYSAFLMLSQHLSLLQGRRCFSTTFHTTFQQIRSPQFLLLLL